MANLKHIRKRIVSVKSTQKITRAMKMVAAAQLNRAQQRIIAVRPYAVKTAQVLSEVVVTSAETQDGEHAELMHPLLARRPEKRALILVVTGDRGLCGAFNSNVLRLADRVWREREAEGQKVMFGVVGRKGRDYFRRRGAPVFNNFHNIWERLDLEQARGIARSLLTPFARGEVDAIYLVYNEFKSAVSQRPVMELLFPLPVPQSTTERAEAKEEWARHREFLFEPDQSALLERLVPMYVEISILRALLESRASELGAQMTAMDAATKNASEMIAKLTLDYNRARQAAITTELMEIIGGAEALRNG
ncbi:MAG TPA: ATP synthase F1 subunit gamma [Polyangiaceae bacterium]|nr:ATP synthase F1 subunit gamma [Polyangiaceae bacterium]